MRDHLMGYVPSAVHAADLEEDMRIYGMDTSAFDGADPYPCGVPKRAQKEWAARFEPSPADLQRERELENFHCLNHPLPDGSFQPARKLVKAPTIHDLISDTMKKRSDAFTANVVKKNALLKDFLEQNRVQGLGAVIGGAGLAQQGSSLKASGYDILNVPADAVLEFKPASIPVRIDAAEPVGIVQAYMAGYGQQRADITREVQLSAREKAEAWNKERAAQLKHNDEQRYLQAMAERQLAHYAGQQGARNSPWHTAIIKPDGPVVQASSWGYVEEPCAIVPL